MRFKPNVNLQAVDQTWLLVLVPAYATVSASQVCMGSGSPNPSWPRHALIAAR